MVEACWRCSTGVNWTDFQMFNAKINKGCNHSVMRTSTTFLLIEALTTYKSAIEELFLPFEGWIIKVTYSTPSYSCFISKSERKHVFGSWQQLRIRTHFHFIRLFHFILNNILLSHLFVLNLPFRYISEEIPPINTIGGGKDHPPCHGGVKRPETRIVFWQYEKAVASSKNKILLWKYKMLLKLHY